MCPWQHPNWVDIAGCSGTRTGTTRSLDFVLPNMTCLLRRKQRLDRPVPPAPARPFADTGDARMMVFGCEDTRRSVDAFIDGETDPSASVLVDAHVTPRLVGTHGRQRRALHVRSITALVATRSA